MSDTDSKPNLPPTTLSVVIPAIPSASAKDDAGEKTIEIACVAVLVAAAGLWFTAEAFDLRWIGMAILIVTLVCLTYWATWRHRKTLGKHRQFEEKLHDMALQLGEKNIALKQLVQIDPLTELLNRRGLEKALGVEMSRARRRGGKVFAVLLDCDDFKAVNEGFGHAVGDLVLQSMARNILRSIRPTDYASRVGGDEFIVLLIDLDQESAIRVAERIRLMISDYPVVSGSKTVPCTASLGIAELPHETCSIEEVLTLCRLALKSSKAAGKNRLSVSGSHQIASLDELGENDIDGLLHLLSTGKAVKVVWQPIYRLSDKTIIGYEALARGPKGPFEKPSALFKLCQEHGILAPVDMKCLKLALSQMPVAPADVQFHINLFPSTLLEIPLEALDDVLAKSRDRKLCVEVSEQQFLGDPACLIDHVCQLKERGINIALDDVGFTRSSLESLIVLEPNFLKVHNAFTKDIARDPAKQKYVSRLLAIAGSIDAELIAEGIESQDDCDVLKHLGVTIGQGFHLGEPKDLSESPQEAKQSVGAGQPSE